MLPLSNTFNTLKTLKSGAHYYSLPAFESYLGRSIQRLPVTIRIMLESLLRNCDGLRVKEEDIQHLASWSKTPQNVEVPFIVSRVILQDFTGVPLLVDLAAMRDAIAKQGRNAQVIEPIVPVDLVIDHSVQVDRAGTPDAFLFNLEIEGKRNQERYSFLKWGQQAFKTFQVVPPGIGIVHQVNLEHIATVVTLLNRNGQCVVYPDTLVGTDSHTTMVNGLGVLGWGVGGIEAEAAMLGQPVSLQMPEVIGVHLSGKLPPGSTATDLTLRITELLRNEKVVGKFVEFFGEGAASLTVADRATIGNMSPEYGATIGFFPVDDQTLTYLQATGRTPEHIELVKEYLTAQKLFGIPLKGEVEFSKELSLDLTSVRSCVAGPKRPQDRIDLHDLKDSFQKILSAPIANGGYGKSLNDPFSKICIHETGNVPLPQALDSGGTPELEVDGEIDPPGWSEVEMVTNRPFTYPVENPHYGENGKEISEEGLVCDIILSHGSIVIAAITSCTNTSNPSVMLGAGLLAKKAVERGLKVNPMIKTSLAPGSRVVTDYLEKTGLQKYLDQLGFQLVAYGCTTCIGNSGPLEERIEEAIKEHDLIAASVLSGNRNFEARIHGAIKANFLMSPPLVVAFAIAGRINIDFEKEPLGYDQNKKPVFLKDLWPSSEEIQKTIQNGLHPEMFQKRYGNILDDNPLWKEVGSSTGAQYKWDSHSTYIQNPPYFEEFKVEKVEKREPLQGMRALAIFGDSVTTDHISPAGAFRLDTPAGKYLHSLGVKEIDFNSYGSRRGNHQVMVRGTFANVRIRNKMAGDREGGWTRLVPEGNIVSIFEASEIYAKSKTPLIVIAGKDYGMGSSRDWAAKGPALMGVKVVVAKSFERIHRSNLIGMGILPLEFHAEDDAETLNLSGNEVYSLSSERDELRPQQQMTLEVKNGDAKKTVSVTARLDTMIEVEYYLHGGILPYVLRQILSQK